MASLFFAKIYIEILDDWKMGSMTDRLWRRTIEMILLAKERNAEGLLPDIRNMAYRLHTDVELLEAELNDLAKLGIVQLLPAGWHVVNFMKWQGPATSTERVRRYREREKKREYNSPVTHLERTSNDNETKRYTEKNRIEKKKVDEDYPPRGGGNHQHQQIDPFLKPAIGQFVDWWLDLVGASMPTDTETRRCKLYEPAERLLSKLDGDMPKAKELVAAKREDYLNEGKTPKWLESVVYLVFADGDKPIDDEWWADAIPE